jgi:urate oxidase
MSTLSDNAYGKSGIRLVRVARRGARHELRDWTLAVRFRGAYDAAYRDGDNRDVLPTDTMKNTVYAFAKERPFGAPEEFARALVEHFTAHNTEAQSVAVEIVERPWSRLPGAGEAGTHDHAFTPAPCRRHAWVERDAQGMRVRGGVSEMVLLKTTSSGFARFRRDRYTTLPETDDRILATAIEASWQIEGSRALDHDELWATAKAAIEESFGAHFSRSVQELIWIMGNAVLARCPAIASIHLRLPNLHHLPVDLSPFGLDGRGEVFVATSAPYGLIEGTVRRGT